MNVCLGGTFDLLHRGHKQLIITACKLAGANGVVIIGVTSGVLGKKQRKIHSYAQRTSAIKKFLPETGTNTQVVITLIQDNYGPSIQEDFDAIVVSPETKLVAEEINVKRKQKGKKLLQIVVVPFVLAEDGRPISSTRIRNGEIDENGTLLKKE
jgi:pantetheine-phosphate adenylyltransferase